VGAPALVVTCEPGRVTFCVPPPLPDTVMLLPNRKVEVVRPRCMSSTQMPPRMPMVLDGVVMVIGLVLLILPPDQAQHALAGTDRDLADLGVGIVDEFVDSELGVRPDSERRAVEEDEMGAVVRAGADHFVGLHIDADAQHALGLLWWLAEWIAVGCGGDAYAGKGGAGAGPDRKRRRRAGRHAGSQRHGNGLGHVCLLTLA